jgi:hypothetical protein
LALVVIDSQLATRSRSREKARLDRERNRAAERAERQRQAAALTNRCALLSGRLQLDPSTANRDRFRAFLALMAAATGGVD